MYARINTLTLVPGAQQAAERLADEATKLCRDLPGFKSITFFGNWETGECGSFSVWETKEALEAALSAVQPLVKKHIGALVKGTPHPLVYEAYEPNA